MESCARGDYARERNKEGQRRGNSERKDKTERWKEAYVLRGQERGGGMRVERGGHARVEKEIFCGAHGSP